MEQLTLDMQTFAIVHGREAWHRDEWKRKRGESSFGETWWAGRTEFTKKIGSEREWQRNRGLSGSGKMVVWRAVFCPRALV